MGQMYWALKLYEEPSFSFKEKLIDPQNCCVIIRELRNRERVRSNFLPYFVWTPYKLQWFNSSFCSVLGWNINSRSGQIICKKSMVETFNGWYIYKSLVYNLRGGGNIEDHLLKGVVHIIYNINMYNYNGRYAKMDKYDIMREANIRKFARFIWLWKAHI